MRISTRFTVLSVSITTLAAIVSIAAILLSEFNHQKQLLQARVETSVATGYLWAQALHFKQQAVLTEELGLLTLSDTQLEAAVATDINGEVLATSGQPSSGLARLRKADTDALSAVTATLQATGTSGRTLVAGLDIPYVFAISVPVLATVNPLDAAENVTAYQLAAAENASGARFVVGYIETQTPFTSLLLGLLPRAHTLLIATLVLLTIAFLYVRSTVRRISRPMEELAATADEISSGRAPRTLAIGKHQNDEIGDIASVLNGVIEGVHKMTTQLNVDRELMSLKVDSTKKQLTAAEAKVSQTRNRLKRVAYYDPVTALPNRRLILEQLTMLINIAVREQRHLGTLVFNVDNLRKLNESMGREAGDAMLRAIAARLTDALRKSDVIGMEREDGQSPSISRIGNNEFCVLLHGLSNAEDAIQAAARIHDALVKPIEIAGTVVAPSLTVGVAVAPEHGGTSEDILRAADIAANAAGQAGNIAPVLFSPELDAAGSERFQLENDLRRANFDREFQLHYQPQIDSRAGKIVGAEALIRWQHPKRGAIPPFKFIPIAEESGIIIDLGNWIIDRACADLAAFLQQGLPLPKVSVNISALQLTDELVDVVRNALARHDLPAGQLELELTESLLVQDIDAVLEKLNRLSREVGVRLSVDDFGTGYSSLAYLARFPLDELKVDRSFVVGMEADESAAKVTGAIIAMAQQLELDIVVEGVDNPLQLHKLQAFGATVIQGFLFARPMPAAELRDYITNAEWQAVIDSIEPAP